MATEGFERLQRSPSERACDLETGQVCTAAGRSEVAAWLGLAEDTGDKALRKAESSVLARFGLSCWRWKLFREDKRLSQVEG